MTEIQAEVKEVATSPITAPTVPLPTRPIVSELPTCYARYVDEKCWQLIDSKKAPNKEFITYLINTITARFRARYPILDDSFAVNFSIAGQMQILMLARILYVSALTSDLTNAISNPSTTHASGAPSIVFASDICKKFHFASVEHDAWAWFSGAVGPNEKCLSLMSMVIPNELTHIAGKMIAIESSSISIPGSTVHASGDGDQIVECALFAVVDSIARLVFDFWSPCVDLDARTCIKLSSNDVSGILRLFNHGRIPAQSQFFIELGQFGNQFEAVKKGIKAKDAATKPHSAGRKKK